MLFGASCRSTPAKTALPSVGQSRSPVLAIRRAVNGENTKPEPMTMPPAPSGTPISSNVSAGNSKIGFPACGNASRPSAFRCWARNSWSNPIQSSSTPPAGSLATIGSRGSCDVSASRMPPSPHARSPLLENRCA